jgi:hypothetical protein
MCGIGMKPKWGSLRELWILTLRTLESSPSFSAVPRFPRINHSLCTAPEGFAVRRLPHFSEVLGIKRSINLKGEF